MALPTNNSSNDPFKGRNREEEIPNPFDDDEDDLDEGFPRGGLPAQPQRPARERPVASPSQGLPSLPPAEPQPVRRRPTPVAPPAPEPEVFEDDAFEPLPVDEITFEDEYEPEPAPAPVRRPQQAPRRAPAPTPVPEYDDFEFEDEPEETKKPRIKTKPDPRIRKPDIEETERSDFVNEKKRKLVPFGGNASKNTSEAGKFDSRENRKAQARAVQIGVLVLLTGATLLGLWNVINPPKGVTLDDVNAVVAANNSANDFPLDRGASFAEAFLDSYLNVDATEAEFSDPILSYYYTGNISGEATTSAPTVEYDPGFGQRTVVNAKTFDSLPVEANTASFIVGALVQKYNINAPIDPSEMTPEQRQASLKWVYFNVNVYYDRTMDQMLITPDSPQLIGPQTLGATTELPEELLPGTGVEATAKAEDMRDIIYAYFDAYGQATKENSSGLNPFVINNPPVEVYNGFGGDFILSDEAATAITFKPYETLEPGVYDVDVQVTWRDAYDTESSAIYRSRYLLEMSETAPGDFKVSGLFTKKYREAIE